MIHKEVPVYFNSWNQLFIFQALALIGVPLVILFRKTPIFFHIFLTVLILFSTVASNVIIFLPKVRDYTYRTGIYSKY